MADSRPETFGARMVRREKQLTDTALRTTKGALRAVLHTLVWTTRVDTGRARSNWIVTKNKPSSRQITNFPAGKKGSTGEACAQLAIARGNVTIRTMTLKNPGAWFVNNVPYIKIINYKYGDMMLERAITAGNTYLRTTRIFS